MPLALNGERIQFSFIYRALLMMDLIMKQLTKIQMYIYILIPNEQASGDWCKKKT